MWWYRCDIHVTCVIWTWYGVVWCNKKVMWRDTSAIWRECDATWEGCAVVSVGYVLCAWRRCDILLNECNVIWKSCVVILLWYMVVGGMGYLYTPLIPQSPWPSAHDLRHTTPSTYEVVLVLHIFVERVSIAVISVWTGSPGAGGVAVRCVLVVVTISECYLCCVTGKGCRIEK